MNGSKNNENEAKQGEAAAAAEKPEGAAGRPSASGAEAGAPTPSGAPEQAAALENLRLENAGLRDKLLRTLAEMENLRRRSEREIAESKLYGVTSFARDMLTFADTLRRALDSVPPSVREDAEGPWKALAEGIELTERDFLSRLGKYGVKKFDSLGVKFDPHLHEALFEVPDETVPNGTVVQIVEDGYAIGDRVLRPAKVGVSRGGPMPMPANETASA